MDYSNKQIKVLFLTIFLNLTGFALILPLSPSLLHFYLKGDHNGKLLDSVAGAAQGLAEKVAGSGDSLFMTTVFFGCLLASLYAFLQFVFAPIWGRLSDRFGRRPILLMTLFGSGLSYLLWAFSGTFELFFLSRIAAGIMAGNLAVATAAMADITSKKNRTKGMALMGAAFGLGFLLGPAIGGLSTKINLVQYFPGLAPFGLNPFSTPALISLGLTVLNLAWVSSQFKESLSPEKRSSSKPSQVKDLLKQMTPAIRKTNLSYFIFILSFSGLEFTLAFLAAERFGYGPVQIGYLFLYIGFVLILTQGYIVRKLSNKLTEKNICILGMFSGMLSFAILAFAYKQSSFFLGSAFLALSIGLCSPSLSSLVSLYATEKTQGLFLGKFRSAGSLARACGPISIAFVYFYFGAQAAYLSSIFILLIPILIVATLPTPDKSEEGLEEEVLEENKEKAFSASID